MSKLAIAGGEPVRTKPWPEWPQYDETDEQALLEVLRSRRWYNAEKGREFAEAFARFQDAAFGIPTTNGTAALEAALVCCGVGAGDEVIIPAYTFQATGDAVLKANAVPVFCDIEPDTFNIDVAEAAKLVTDRTKAVIPVHWAGLPCDMDALGELAAAHGLAIVEDACHSWGSAWKGKGTGALGDAGAFSFQQSKNITAGEGGIALTDDAHLAGLLAAFVNCGRGVDEPDFGHFRNGTNYRMTELQAALLLAQLARLPEHNARRAENAAILGEGLAGIPGLHLIRQDERVTRRAWHAYLLRYVPEGDDMPSRDRVMDALNAEGIRCWGGYTAPLYHQIPYARTGGGPAFCPASCPYRDEPMDYSGVNCPNAERVCGESIWIPQNMLLGTPDDMADIVTAFRKIHEHGADLALARRGGPGA
jgi:dTDP-4-amino-4,6-dideoxygalactose transaminase